MAWLCLPKETGIYCNKVLNGGSTGNQLYLLSVGNVQSQANGVLCMGYDKQGVI